MGEKKYLKPPIYQHPIHESYREFITAKYYILHVPIINL